MSRGEGTNILHIKYTPRWSWFHPPLWRIFRWAYKKEMTLYTGCYPISFGGDLCRHDDSKEVSFTGKYEPPFALPTIDENHPVYTAYMQWLNKVKSMEE